MSNLCVKNCTIRAYQDCPCDLLSATVTDLDNNSSFEISEWVSTDTHHVDRENSCIIDNKQSPEDVAIFELFEAIDSKLDQMYNKEDTVTVIQKLTRYIRSFKV